MKNIVISMIMICTLVLGHIQAQYISGKTLPDQNPHIVQDLEDVSFKLSTTISTQEIKEHIFTLASDEFEGRETGTKGNDKAGQYISSFFANLGLKDPSHTGSYFQPVDFTFTSWEGIDFSIGGNSYALLKDFIALPQLSTSAQIEAEEILFLGFGIEDDRYNDYHNIDVQDKVLMVFEGEPMDDQGASLITGSAEHSEWSTDWQKKSQIARDHGASLLIIITNDLSDMIATNRRALVNRVTQLGKVDASTLTGINTIFISPSVGEEIFGAHRDQMIANRKAVLEGTSESMAITLPYQVVADLDVKRDVLESRNVMGVIEGSTIPEEYVVISAHYDHIGTKAGEVYNGADDDASGTTGVLEIAEALMTAKKMGIGPKRSVICMLVTGEEKGLLGSRYYTENPIYPLNQTIANVNIDMIGRRGYEYLDNKTPYVYVIGSDRLSSELHDINESANRRYSNLLLDYKYNDEKDPNRFYFRSDHYNFAKHGIPAIFYFNGVHDDYHRLTDTPDKIDLLLLRDRARLIFHTVWELANRKDAIKVDEVHQSSP